MNVKKYLLTITAMTLCVGSFAYPAPQEEDPAAKLLKQYEQQAQELQQSFEKYLLPPLQNTAQLALEMQNAGQAEMSEQQEELLNQYAQALDNALNQLVIPTLKDLDVAQFNQQYKQIAQTYGLPEQEFTLQTITDTLKGMYLMGAMTYFEQTQKLSEDELTILMEIFLQQEEGNEIN